MKEEVEIPEKIEVKINEKVVVAGPKGKIEKNLKHPWIKIKKEGGKVVLRTKEDRRKEKRLLNTFVSKIKNAIQGVKKKYGYQLKVCYKHFPISVEVKGSKVLIKNFLHEKQPRKAKILGETEVKVEDDTIIVKGIDKEKAGQTAANIEQATQTNLWDKRVIGDGIYIVKKP